MHICVQIYVYAYIYVYKFTTHSGYTNLVAALFIVLLFAAVKSYYGFILNPITKLCKNLFTQALKEIEALKLLFTI